MINWPNHRMFVYLSVKKLKFKTSKETCARATMAFSEFTTELSSCEMTWFDCDSFPISPGHPWPHQSTIPFLKANELKKNDGSRSDSAYLSVSCVLACLSRQVSIEGKFPAKWNGETWHFLRWETVGWSGPTGWRSLSGGFSEPWLGICGYFQEKEILRNLETKKTNHESQMKAWKTSSKTHLQLGHNTGAFRRSKLRGSRPVWQKWGWLRFHASKSSESDGTFMKLHDHFSLPFQVFQISDFPKMWGSHALRLPPAMSSGARRLAKLVDIRISCFWFLVSSMFYGPIWPYGPIRHLPCCSSFLKLLGRLEVFLCFKSMISVACPAIPNGFGAKAIYFAAVYRLIPSKQSLKHTWCLKMCD